MHRLLCWVGQGENGREACLLRGNLGLPPSRHLGWGAAPHTVPGGQAGKGGERWHCHMLHGRRTRPPCLNCPVMAAPALCRETLLSSGRGTQAAHLLPGCKARDGWPQLPKAPCLPGPQTASTMRALWAALTPAACCLSGHFAHLQKTGRVAGLPSPQRSCPPSTSLQASVLRVTVCLSPSDHRR